MRFYPLSIIIVCGLFDPASKRELVIKPAIELVMSVLISAIRSSNK